MPDSIRTEIVEASPLAVPFAVGFSIKGVCRDRPVLEIKEAGLGFIDQMIIANFEDGIPLISSMWNNFLEWLDAKERRIEKIREDAHARFLPHLTDGRYTAAVQDYDVEIIAAGLALFAAFLRFANKCAWLSPGEANDYLTAVWKCVLPQSLPHEVSGAGAWNDKHTFFNFLKDYLAENQAHIARSTPCERGMVAAICNKDDGVYFIAPQDAIAVAYHRWLADHRIFWADSSTGLDLLRALCDAGVACKREVKNKKVQAWRFGFYKGESKIACLTFTIDDQADALAQISKIAPETVSDKSPDVYWASEDTSGSRNA